MGNSLEKEKVIDAMDNNNEDNLQNVDNEATNVMTDCLCNSVIVRTILEKFSSPQLRQLSFVNKIWKDEAQSLMRKRGRFNAYVKGHGLKPCSREKVDDFISDLKQMNPVPFSGIFIHIDFDAAGFDPSAILPLDPLQGITFDQPLLKALSVVLQGSWLDNMASPAFLITKKLLQDCSIVLERLTLFVDFDREDFFEKVVHDVTFPRLKTLKLDKTYNESDKATREAGDEDYMKLMVSRAPNLKVLHSDWPINFMVNVLEGRSVVPVYTRRVSAPFKEISENVIRVIRLRKMELKYTGFLFNLERFNRIAPQLLQKSCTTSLRAMWLDPVLAVPLMNYGITLKNVNYLSMDLNYNNLEHEQRRILNIVKNFNFTRIFPNLNRVKIDASNLTIRINPDHMEEIIEQANAVLTGPTLDRAANVKILYLEQRIFMNEVVQFFADMLPNIQRLDIIQDINAMTEAEQIPFVSIFERWMDLKVLKARGNMLPNDQNLDSVFCGIFPEEVAELRLKDDDYLNRVNIVPVMPALTCLKNLTVLSLNFDEGRYYDPSDNSATCLFSKVTALLAFARMPDLSLSFHISFQSEPPAMTHLEPYASITYEEWYDNEEWTWD